MLKDTIEKFSGAPYVYTYPPTRAFVPTPGFTLEGVSFTKELNIYVHVPFCDQQCTFCGYLTAVERSDAAKMEYMKSVASELELYAPLIASSRITSINFGGGTPSAVPIGGVASVLKALRTIQPYLVDCAELSIETTPERATTEWCADIKALGFNRISMGIQSFLENEIRKSGRHNPATVTLSAIDAVRRAQIPNLCCDLMYGLEGQTLDSWKMSVAALIEFRPETIELYRTVAIPGTIYPKRLTRVMSEHDKYACYQFARIALLEEGYVQEAHLRFVLPNRGFYLQQTNAFKGESLLGVGVGARTYAKNMHYRNVYDRAGSKHAIASYISTIKSGKLAVESVAPIKQDDVMRQYAIYQLGELHLDDFVSRFGISFADAFSDTWREIFELELASNVGNVLRLTEKGLMFRDVIAQTFFSDHTKRLERSHYHA